MKHVYYFAAVMLIVFIFPQSVYAQDGNVPYSVSAQLPENQVNEKATYFDIEMEQGDRQNLEVVIYNSSDEAITVNVDNTFATTNSNGLIVYDGSTEEPDDSMEYPFNEISSLDEDEVNIDPLSEETVTVNVIAPDESFDGVILGGLYFTMTPEDTEEDGGLQIQNQYSYALAVQISEAGNETEVEPELVLESVSPGIVNLRTGLDTQFVNTAPVMIGGLEFTGSVFEEDGEEPLYTRTVEDFTIAPNSRFDFPVMYDNERLEAGAYVFRAQAENDSHEWSFEEPFEVTEEEAEGANETAVELEEDDSWLITVVAVMSVVILILIAVVAYLVLRRRK